MYEGGDPYLRPTIAHDVSLDVMCNWISFGVEYLYEDNPIIWYVTLYNHQDIAFLRNVNFSSKQTMTAYVIAAPKFDWYQPTWQVFFQKPFLMRKIWCSSWFVEACLGYYMEQPV